jgi:hypothetical protein
MYEDERTELVCDGKESIEAFVAEVDAAYPRPDLHAEVAGQPHASAEFLDRSVGILQWYGRECAEALWAFANQLGEEVVLRRCQIQRTGRCGVVAERDGNRRDDLDRHSLAIHVGEPGLR